MGKSAYDIFNLYIDRVKNRDKDGETETAEAGIEVNPNTGEIVTNSPEGAINEALVRGGKKFKGYVVSLKKLTDKKKASTRKIYKNVKKEIKKRKEKGTRKQDEVLKAWKLQENGLGKRIGKMKKNIKTSKKIDKAFSVEKPGIGTRMKQASLLRKLKKKAPKYSNSILKDDYYKDKLIEHKDVLLSTVDSPKKSAFKMLKKPKKNKVSDLLWDIWATHHFVTLMEDLDNPARIMTGYNPDNLFNTDPNIESVIMEDELKDFGLRTKTHKQYPDAIDYDKLKKNKTKAIEWLKKNWKKEQDGKKEWLWVQKGGRRKTRKKRGGEQEDPSIGQIFYANESGINEFGFEQDKEYKVTSMNEDTIYFNDTGVDEDDYIEKHFLYEYFYTNKASKPGGRKKKRKRRCTKKKRKKRR